ncbi:hydrophobic protein [Musa troglodytarum]|uniref:Hydrophobic protein n=1 Tax=Musa troglodytarum TaxID=320322 RepID=A0A9E7JRI3_9LILI|nr:hydrophobic protein [Musa troglodytarum]
MADEGAATCIDILLAIILPPLGVFLKFGCKAEFWICLLLTILGYIPGIIYAVYAITKKELFRVTLLALLLLCRKWRCDGGAAL